MYYVYTLSKPDGTVFYVGKGTGYRIDQHEWEAKTGKSTSGKGANPYKINTIRKIWREGGQVVKEKVFFTEDEGEAYKKEQELIEQIGVDNLTNIRAGGRVEGDTCSPNAECRGKHTLYMRENNINAKTWEGFVDPFGVEYRNIVNLHRFCEEHNLSYQIVVEVNKGTYEHHKGWRKIGKPCWTETEVPEKQSESPIPAWLENMVEQGVSKNKIKNGVVVYPDERLRGRKTENFERTFQAMYEFRKYMRCVIL